MGSGWVGSGRVGRVCNIVLLFLDSVTLLLASYNLIISLYKLHDSIKGLHNNRMYK